MKGVFLTPQSHPGHALRRFVAYDRVNRVRIVASVEVIPEGGTDLVALDESGQLRVMSRRGRWHVHIGRSEDEPGEREKSQCLVAFRDLRLMMVGLRRQRGKQAEDA